MCGVVGYVGNVNPALVAKVVEESKVRGLHSLGSYILPNAGIYHTRYCTSGDAPQPIMKGKVGIVMNGVICMDTKKYMEKKFNVKMDTDNDAELLSFFSPTDFRNHFPNASIACLILTPKYLLAYRNAKRPLWIIQKGKSVLLASTRDILKRAGADYEAAKLLTPEKEYRWTI